MNKLPEPEPKTTGLFTLQRLMPADSSESLLTYVEQDMARYLLAPLADALFDGRERSIRIVKNRERTTPAYAAIMGAPTEENFHRLEVAALLLLLDPQTAAVGEYVDASRMPNPMFMRQAGAKSAALRVPVNPLTFDPVKIVLLSGSPQREIITCWQRTS